MASIKPSLKGIQHALRVHTGDGDYMVDPGKDPVGYGALLNDSRDARVQEARTASDAANPNPLAPGHNPAMEAFNRSQEDAAMGPGGWNRQWASVFEAPNVIQDNNPGTKYKTDYGGLAGPADELAGLSTPMPPSHEQFMAQLQKRLGPR